MKTSYLFPIGISILITAFFTQLPPLKTCALPGDEDRMERIGRKDLLIMALIMLLYAGIAFIGLGNKQSPQSFAGMSNATAVLKAEEGKEVSTLMYFSGVGEGGYFVEYSGDGVSWAAVGNAQQSYSLDLKWNTFTPETAGIPNYIRLTGYGNVYLGEVTAFDAEGTQILLTAADDSAVSEQLCDEQDTAVKKQHFLNSSYFDEIYHARTAWEHLNAVTPYEISHPPLGKLIIALGIKLFGMTPFGWRFSGTLLGVLMLPLLYVFAKKLFGGFTVPTACTVISATDFMHFAQTRIATIDTYGVFFMLLMYLFMYLFIQAENGDGKHAAVYLALSGVFFGMGAASKWTGIYAGAGLALIWALFWIMNSKRGFKAFAGNALFCIVFFVIVPALIYYVSYFAYGTAKGLHGIGMFFTKEYAQTVLDNQKLMFSYHSGLVAEHPYASRWYQWILNIRPILYYLENYADGTRSSFGAFVNPLLCWGGLLSLFVLVYTAFFRGDRKALFILLGYLAQLVPWIAVTRLTFEYHYFPCTVFLVLSLGYSFKLICSANRYGKYCVGGFVLVSAALFVMFYPELSGICVDNASASVLLKWLPTWPF